MSARFLAVVNPAAGGGRCGKLAGPALEKLRAAGVELEVIETRTPGQATRFVLDAYRAGYRRFIAVGGDGTSYEIVNGLFPGAEGVERPTLWFLPLGTGNSVLRDFTEREGIKLGAIAQPLRAALTGATVSPPVFEVMAALGRAETLARIDDAAG